MDTSIWGEVLKILAVAAPLSAALAWLIKSLITHWLSKDIDLYKARLEADSQRQIEELKAQFGKLNKEHEVRFTVLHAQRAELLAELYAQLQDAHTHTVVLGESLKRVGPSGQTKRAEAAYNATRDALTLLGKRRLFLPRHLPARVKDLLLQLSSPSIDYRIHEKGLKSEEDMIISAAEWMKQQGAIEEAMEFVETEFRAILEEPTGRAQAELDVKRADYPTI